MALEFLVRNQRLKLFSGGPVVADSQQYLKARFTFTEDWQGLRKYAQFRRNGEVYTLNIGDNGEVEVPWETLVGQGVVQISAFATNQQDEANKLITTNPVYIKVNTSGIKETELPKSPSLGILGDYVDQSLQEITDHKNKVLVYIEQLHTDVMEAKEHIDQTDYKIYVGETEPSEDITNAMVWINPAEDDNGSDELAEAVTAAQNAAKEVKEIYGDGNFTPLSDLLGGLGTKLKRWGSIFANKVFASNLPIVYNSVAEMKADTMLWEGMNTKTLGYYTPNDGGGASYLIRAKTDSDVDDGGSIHELSNGLVAELIVENGTVCPEQFGAKGDGISDDTQALQECINSSSPSLLTKCYRITQTLNIPNIKKIIGSGYQKGVANKSTILVDLQENGDGLCLLNGHSIFIEKIQILKKDTNNRLINGINLKANVSDCAFRDISINGFNIGINVEYSWSLIFDHITIYNCTSYCIRFNFITTSSIRNSAFFDTPIGIDMIIGVINIYDTDFDKCHIAIDTYNATSPIVLYTYSCAMECYSTTDGGLPKAFIRSAGNCKAINYSTRFRNAGFDTLNLVMVTNGRYLEPIEFIDLFATQLEDSSRIGVSIDDSCEYGCVRYNNVLSYSGGDYINIYDNKVLTNGYYPMFNTDTNPVLHCEYVGPNRKHYYGFTKAPEILFNETHAGTITCSETGEIIIIDNSNVKPTPSASLGTYTWVSAGNWKFSNPNQKLLYVDMFVAGGYISPSDYARY